MLSILPVQAACGQLSALTEREVSILTPTAVPDDCSVAEISLEIQPAGPLPRVDTPPSGASMGRKRAFSDPGDVKRPSTASTDRLEEKDTLISLPNNYQNLQFGDFQRNQYQHDQALHHQPLVQSVYVPNQVPEGHVSMQHPVDNGIGYPGYGYPMYVQVSVQKLRVAEPHLRNCMVTCSRVCSRTIRIRPGWISVPYRFVQRGKVVWRVRVWKIS